ITQAVAYINENRISFSDYLTLLQGEEDAATGVALQTLEGHSDLLRAVAFSPDGSQVASGSANGIVRLWDPATRPALHTLEGHLDSVWAVAFSPDGSRLASGSDDGTVRLWDPLRQPARVRVI